MVGVEVVYVFRPRSPAEKRGMSLKRKVGVRECVRVYCFKVCSSVRPDQISNSKRACGVNVTGAVVCRMQQPKQRCNTRGDDVGDRSTEEVQLSRGRLCCLVAFVGWCESRWEEFKARWRSGEPHTSCCDTAQRQRQRKTGWALSPVSSKLRGSHSVSSASSSSNHRRPHLT